MSLDREDHLEQMVLVVFLERGAAKETQGTEDLWDQRGLQEEPLSNEGQRDLRGLLGSLASQGYQVFLDELGN